MSGSIQAPGACRASVFGNEPVLKPSPFETCSSILDPFDTVAPIAPLDPLDPLLSLSLVAKGMSICTLEGLNTAEMFGSLGSLGSLGDLGSLGSLGGLMLPLDTRPNTITVSDGLSGSSIASFSATSNASIDLAQYCHTPGAVVVFCRGDGSVVTSQQKATVNDDVVVIEFATGTPVVRVVYMCRVDLFDRSMIAVCTDVNSPYINAACASRCFEATMHPVCTGIDSVGSDAYSKVVISKSTFVELS